MNTTPTKPWRQDLVVKFFLALPVGLLGLRFILGLEALNYFGFDDMFILSVAERVARGEIPHVDFYSPQGFLYGVVLALGFLIDPKNLDLVFVGIATIGLALFYSLYFVLRKLDFTRLRSLLFCYASCGFLISPRIFNHPISYTSIAQIYNSMLAVTLLCALILIAAPLLRADRENKRILSLVGTLFGVHCFIAYAIKPNIGLMLLVGGSAASFLVLNSTRQFAASLTFSFLFLFGLSQFYVPVTDYLRDFLYTIDVGLRWIDKREHISSILIPLFPFLLFSTSAMTRYFFLHLPRRPNHSRFRPAHSILLGVAFTSAGVLLSMSISAQEPEENLFVCIPALLLLISDPLLRRSSKLFKGLRLILILGVSFSMAKMYVSFFWLNPNNQNISSNIDVIDSKILAREIQLNPSDQVMFSNVNFLTPWIGGRLAYGAPAYWHEGITYIYGSTPFGFPATLPENIEYIIHRNGRPIAQNFLIAFEHEFAKKYVQLSLSPDAALKWTVFRKK